MESNASRAVGELASAKVDSVAYCCTVSGALRGMEGDRQFCQELESEWNTPITSTMWAVAEALQHLGLKKIVVTTPYPESHHVAERAYLKEAGIEALTMQGMGFETADGFASVSPQEIFDFAMNAWKDHSDEADGLFISCMNHDGMAAAQSHHIRPPFGESSARRERRNHCWVMEVCWQKLVRTFAENSHLNNKR